MRRGRGTGGIVGGVVGGVVSIGGIAECQWQMS
jgi:hypothetical protein